jgi:SAM-dependent methyltransferase
MTETPRQTRDDDTLRYYAEHAAQYAVDSLKVPRSGHMDYFEKNLPPRPRVLELGCGAGRDTAEMIRRGFDVLPTDGSPEMAREAEARLGMPVKVMLFEELDFREAFDGVWAHAALLHVPRGGLPDVIRRVHAALKPGGLLYASFKSGEAGGRDIFGRYYNYPSREVMISLFEANGTWRDIIITVQPGGSYEGGRIDWLHCFVTKA